MQRLEVSGAVRPIYGSLGVKRLSYAYLLICGTKTYQKNSVTLYVASTLLAFNMVIRVDAEIIFSIMSVFRVFHLLLHLWLFCNTRTLSYFCFHFLSVSIDVFKAQISTAATAGWKPAEGINIRLLCLLCVVVYVATSATGRSFVRRSSTGRKCVCLCVCVCVCVCMCLIVYDLQTPKVGPHMPELGCCAT